MLVLVRFSRSGDSSADATALTADYLAFDRQRRQTVPYLRLFAGLTLLTLFGGAIGTVPPVESVEAAAIFVLPVCGLLLANAWRWSRLQRRLGAIRAEIQQVDS